MFWKCSVCLVSTECVTGSTLPLGWRKGGEAFFWWGTNVPAPTAIPLPDMWRYGDDTRVCIVLSRRKGGRTEDGGGTHFFGEGAREERKERGMSRHLEKKRRTTYLSDVRRESLLYGLVPI